MCGWFSLWAVVPGAGQGLERVPNRTLALPEAPPEVRYRLELAFPGLPTFSQPVAIVRPPGDDGRLFVLERRGRIWVLDEGEEPSRGLFLSLVRRAESGSGEQGVLGLAFHPRYRENGYIYVFYTARGARAPNRLSRFRIDPGNPDRVLDDSELELFSQADDAGNHNGGDLHFGPDGYLYVSLGDEGNANDSLGNSQRLDRDFFAGILRLDVDRRAGNLEPNPHAAIHFEESGEARYLVPADNPWVGTTEFLGRRLDPRRVRTEFWAVGLRNPWRMSFDPVTGALYTGDVGQGRREEIDLVVGGGNYGWNYLEGSLDGPRSAPRGYAFDPPLLEYPHGNGTWQGKSVTGGVVYRGGRLPDLYGAYVFGDYVSGQIWSLRHEGDRVVRWERLAREIGVAAFGTDPRNGDILVADVNSDRILRLVGASSDGADRFPATLSETGAFRDLETLEPHAGIVPYEVNVSFWSDGAVKRRWFGLPDTESLIGAASRGPWSFPEGMVWIKHFEMEMVVGDPASRRRLETRFIVRQPDEDVGSGVYGITYRWDEDGREARLVEEEGRDEMLEIMEEGVVRRQLWRYPGRSECLACHTRAAGGALSFSTAQLDREGPHGDQLQALHRAGYLDALPSGSEPLVPVGDAGADLEQRVRSYLHANCSQCHRPGGDAIGLWDARASVPVAEAGILHGPLANPSLRPARRVVVPGDPSSSELLLRMTSTGSDRMPPVATRLPDGEAIERITRWIAGGLPPETFDEWARRHFGRVVEPDRDHDQDGMASGLEYRMGTSPTDPEDRWRLSIGRDGDALALHFPAVFDPDLVLELQSSSDPGSSWSTVDTGGERPFHGPRGTRGEIPLVPEARGAQFLRVLIHAD